MKFQALGYTLPPKIMSSPPPHCSTLMRIVNDVPPSPEPQKRVLFGDMVLKNSLLARLFSAWNAGL